VPRILSVYRESNLYCQVELTGQGVRLGRRQDNDVVLEDSARRVSREHAQLRWEGSRLVLFDLGSANGTFLNSERVTEIELAPGVEFTIGPYRLSWEDTGEVPTALATTLGPSEVTAAPATPPAAPDQQRPATPPTDTTAR
jgi:pSer/pThr/pTyr-binding forkhead associated (FHA) protein